MTDKELAEEYRKRYLSSGETWIILNDTLGDK